MTQYVVVKNTVPENIQLDIEHKCHKLRKSSGKVLYKITKESNGLHLHIVNTDTTQPASSHDHAVDTKIKSLNLDSILNQLQPNTVAGSAGKLLPFLDENNNAGFITAVLIALGVVRIK
jgi:hypothetical protein